MKKLLFISLFILLFVTGCVGLPVIYQDGNNGNTPETPQTPVVSDGNVKTGLAIVTNLAKSKDQTAEFDITLVAVTVDNNGIITSCKIDSVGTKITFDTTGKITTALDTIIKSKQEQGDAYGMVAYGGAKYEWYVQADSFCKYVKGKTAEEVANISVNESTYPTDPDLPASVTIAIGGYKALVAEALA